jgi:para-nitrobenzyl esterase
LTAADGDALRRLPVAEIMRAQAVVENGSRNWRGFFPVKDEASLPEHPADFLASGPRAHMPLVIGTNRDEWNLFDAGNIAKWNKPLSDDVALGILRSGLPDSAGDRAPAILEVYRSSRTAARLPNDNRALLRAVDGDRRFRIASVRFAEAYAAHCPATYMYLFTHESPALRGALGACHALDLPFVFGTLDAPMQAQFAGTGPGVERLSQTMMTAWLAFARWSDPNRPELPSWPAFEPRERLTLILDEEPRVTAAPLDDERRIWDGVL